MKTKKVQINGFEFQNELDAAEAENELSAIKEIINNMNSKSPSEILSTYNMLIDKGLFKSPTGIEYLRKLQKYLKKNDSINNDDVRPIPISSSLITHQQNTSVRKDNSILCKASIFINIVLIIVIIAMLLINNSNHNINENAYKKEILNKYSDWEQSLNERESAVKEKESINK